MTCETYRQSVDALLEGDLDAATRDEMDRHSAQCEACRVFTLDLQRIRQTAGLLDRRVPSRDAWTKLAARLSEEPAFRKHAPPRAPRGTWSWSILAAAAALVTIVGLSVVLLQRGLFSTTPTSSGNAQTNHLVESIEHDLQQAAEHYEKAISGLEQVANASESPLDPTVMATVRENLTLIDRAIDESRSALRQNPESRQAQASLFEAFRRKVALLQNTITLMNEMRKGNQAGAARIVDKS